MKSKLQLLKALNAFTLNSRTAIAVILSICLTLVTLPAYTADPLPSGEVTVGNIQLEPAYNGSNGSLTYLLTPLGTPLVDHTNQANAVAPLYIIVYPSTVAGVIGTVNCQHQPMDNCPDHGPGVAGAAKFLMSSVYGSGVWGHDHMGAVPPAPPKNGGDWNVAWVPVVVLFKTMQAASHHITTLAQLRDAENAGVVSETYLWDEVFQCSSVSGSVYKLGTPVTPAPPLP